MTSVKSPPAFSLRAFTATVAAVIIIFPDVGHSATWVSRSGDWFTGTNWGAGSIPNDAEDVTLANGGTAQITNNSTALLKTLFLNNGAIAISGDGVKLSSWVAYIGSSGTGTLAISNGAVVGSYGSSQTNYIGYDSRGIGSVTVFGRTSSWGNSQNQSLHIGESGTGEFTLSYYGSALASTVLLGVNAGSKGTLNFGSYTNSSPPYSLSGTLTANQIVFGAGTGVINFNQSDSTTLWIPVSGTGSVVQRGQGVTTIYGGQSYSGTTAAQAGTLLLNGALLSSANSVVVHSNSTFGGMGTIAGTVTVDGTFAPGSLPNSFGGLFVNNNVFLNSTAVLTMTLLGPDSCTKLDVRGAFNVASTAQLSIISLGTLSMGDSFVLFPGTRPFFAADKIILPDLSLNLFWDVSQLSTAGRISVIPEPAIVYLLAAAIALCGLQRRLTSKANFQSKE